MKTKKSGRPNRKPGMEQEKSLEERLQALKNRLEDQKLALRKFLEFADLKKAEDKEELTDKSNNKKNT